MTPGWLAAAADEFWARAKVAPTAPRDLDRAAKRAFSVTILAAPALTVASVEARLSRYWPGFAFDTAPRALCGCLVACRGRGFIFVDEDDEPAERRFTLAHEIAHYLLDYHAPRQDALRRLGPAILPVLNGERPASRPERIDAALTATSLTYYVHLFDRSRSDVVVDLSERRADELAYELLAPAAEVAAEVAADAGIEEVVAVLMGCYGLPGGAARLYARSWLRGNRPAPSDFGWLRR